MADTKLQDSVQEAQGASAPEAEASAEPLFVASYTADLPVLERYARLNVCRQMQVFVALLAMTAIVVGVMLVATQPSLWPIAAACVAFGGLLIVWHQAIPHITAKRLLNNLPANRRHRTVAVYEDRTVLTPDGGKPRVYSMGTYREIRWNEKLDMAVLVFGESGVTVPHEALTTGTWPDLIVWGETHAATPIPEIPTE